jgi:tRNA(adenine34) deaminase
MATRAIKMGRERDGKIVGAAEAPRSGTPSVEHCGPLIVTEQDRKVTALSGNRYFPRDEHFMRLALREAVLALDHDDVPVGAVIVHGGEVIAAGHNERELREDPSAHAEMLAIREAARALGSWRLLDTVLYVTLEPCAMCAGAIVLGRIPRVVYGTVDPKAGAAGSVLDVLGEPRLNHRPDVAGGLLAADSAELLQAFFRSRR